MMRPWPGWLLGAALLAGSSLASAARAATLVIANGELVGATGVLVDGNLYDVQFMDGTCAELYGGCDEASDFPFATSTAANNASFALLAQVLVGIYDDDPELTRGCENLSTCTLTTPYAALPESSYQASGAKNEAAGSSDSLVFFEAEDLVGGPRFTFAVWSVPACAATPDPGCRTGFSSAAFSVIESKPGKERLQLKLAKGPASAAADFGDASAPGGTRYALCVFDDAGEGVAALEVDRAGAMCGSKPCWTVKEGKGASYRDPAAAASGVRAMKLAAGEAGKTKIAISATNNAAKGQDALPTGIAGSLAGSTSVRVELHTSDAECFAATLDEVKRSDADRFQAK